MRNRLAVLLALAAAVALPVSLFLHWYEISGDAGSITMTGWQAFEIVDVLLVIGAIVTIAGLVTGRWRDAVPLMGAVAICAVGFQIIEPPPLLSAYEQGGGVHVSREIGAWLALGASVLLFLAGLARRFSPPG